MTSMSKISLILMGLTAMPLLAQFDSATVLGLVRDASGLGIPKAKLKLSNTRTGIDGGSKLFNKRWL